MQPNKLISGQLVGFRLKDALCPDLTETVRAIGPELQVTGDIVFFSDGHDQEKHFAVIEVTGICTPLIVPVHCLQPITGLTEEHSCQPVKNPSRKAC